ncbi:MAG TPA: DNA primase [Treponemataceae bacterium]|jgi:DNA primase|nr:DNA primase [Treponemataceae bacterium]
MGRISAETIDAVNQRSDILAVIGEYTRLEKRGSDWWGCCPFHNEKTPSFHVLPDKKMYHCFGCGKGGGVINFIMEIEKLTFVETVESLARKFGIEIVYDGGNAPIVQKDTTKDELLKLYDRVAGSFHYLLTQSVHGSAALKYLHDRFVSDEIIAKFRLGYSPADRKWLYSFLRKKGYSEDFLSQSGLFSKKNQEAAFFSNRLMFPICNRKGQVVAFGGRILSGDGPKYLNSSDLPQYKKGETLFAFDLALPEIRTTKSVIFCEGYMDVLAWHQAGISRAVAPLGTAFTDEQASLVRTFADTVYVCFDSDAAGQTATYKAVLLCRTKGFNVRVIQMIDGKDPADILVNKGAEALKKLLEHSIIDLDYLVLNAGNRFDIGTPEGKANALTFLFPYIEVLESDIQRESTINRLSAAFGISEKALLSDYNNRKQPLPKHNTKGSDNSVRTQTVSIKRNAEMRSVLAVAANTNLFPLMRSQLTSDDFEDPAAKELFIALEECYRIESVSYDSLLARLTDENIRNMVSETLLNGEFAENAEKIVSDSITLIRRNILEKRKAKLLSRMNLLHGSGSGHIRAVTDMIAEKKSIDEELSKLKDMNE